MRRPELLMLAPMLLLAACGREAPESSGAVDEGNPLEIAARERGVVRAEAAVPTGVFERTHELGRDAMCIVPTGPGRWRFAITAGFGPGLSCTAGGQVSREGGGWLLRFAGADDCSILVHEEDDELRLPGNMPPQCDNLCPGRASLGGLRLPRASWSEEDAMRLRIRDSHGNMFRPCDG